MGGEKRKNKLKNVKEEETMGGGTDWRGGLGETGKRWGGHVVTVD